MKCRLIHEVSARVVTKQWEGGEECPGRSYHEVEVVAAAVATYSEARAIMKERDLWNEPALWPTKCGYCAHAFAVNGRRSIAPERIYDTTSGKPEPGDMFFLPCTDSPHTDEAGGCYYWDNCRGFHLIAILPTGEEWCVDSRANNCGSPEDRLHRCWVWTGYPPEVTAGKGPGPSCTAGGGSIQTPNYHGMLVSGEFQP